MIIGKKVTTKQNYSTKIQATHIHHHYQKAEIKYNDGSRPVPTGGRTSDVIWSLSASWKQCSSAVFHDFWSGFGARWKTNLQGRSPALVTTIDFVSPFIQQHKQCIINI